MSRTAEPVPSYSALSRPVTVAVVGAALVLVVLTVLIVLDPAGLDTAIAAVLSARPADPGSGAGGSEVALWTAITALGAGPVLGTLGALAAGVLALRRR